MYDIRSMMWSVTSRFYFIHENEVSTLTHIIPPTNSLVVLFYSMCKTQRYSDTSFPWLFSCLPYVEFTIQEKNTFFYFYSLPILTTVLSLTLYFIHSVNVTFVLLLNHELTILLTWKCYLIDDSWFGSSECNPLLQR